MTKKVAIVGAGNAGAAAAFVMKRDGFDVTVFEAENSIGGRCRTIERDGFTIDVGAVYLLNLYSRTVALLRQAGYRDLQEWSPPGALIDEEDQHIIRYDFLPSFLKLKPLALADKIRLLWAGFTTMLRPAPHPYETDSLAAYDFEDMTMENWSRRRLGDQVHEYLVRPWIEPAFGVGVERLSPPFLQGILKRAYRAKFRVPKAGMGDISKALLSGVNVKTSCAVQSVAKLEDGNYRVTTKTGTEVFAGVIMATPAAITANLVDKTIASDAARQWLEQAPYAHMASIALGYHTDPWPHAPFDLALPVGAGDQPVVGIILHGRKAPHNVPDGGQLVNVFINDKATRAFSDEKLCELAVNHVNRWMGSSQAPDFIEFNRHEPALAYASPGHYARMQKLRRAMPHGLALAGDYLAHLGVESAVVSGERAGMELGRFLRSHEA